MVVVIVREGLGSGVREKTNVLELVRIAIDEGIKVVKYP